MRYRASLLFQSLWNDTFCNVSLYSLLLAIVLSSTLASVLNATRVTPESGEVMTLAIAGKQSAYYRIQKDSSLYVTLRGPGTLTGIVRLIPPTRSDSPTTYTLIVSEGERLIKTLNSATSASKWRWLGSTEPAGKSRKFHVRIREGKHRLQFSLRNTTATGAAIKFKLDKRAPHIGELPLYPLSMREQVTIQIRERSLNYAVADKITPVRVRVIGPTRLRIVTRLLYTGLMKGSRQYSISSYIDGKRLPPKRFKTKKSLRTTIVNHPEWISGQSRTFYMPIPKGEHVVRFRMIGAEGPGVAMRYTIPKEDTKP